MLRIFSFLTGALAGLLIAVLLAFAVIWFLPNLLVVDHVPFSAGAIVVLGDGEITRLHKALELEEDGFSKHLILVAKKKKSWDKQLSKLCPDCNIEGKGIVFIEGSEDTLTDAQLSLQYCLAQGIHSVLVVTSPYHTRRAQFVFNDIYSGRGVTATVVSSGDFAHYIPPDGSWWRDRKTIEEVWKEFGKILYWKLTPYMEFKSQ